MNRSLKRHKAVFPCFGGWNYSPSRFYSIVAVLLQEMTGLDENQRAELVTGIRNVSLPEEREPSDLSHFVLNLPYMDDDSLLAASLKHSPQVYQDVEKIVTTDPGSFVFTYDLLSETGTESNPGSDVSAYSQPNSDWEPRKPSSKLTGRRMATVLTTAMPGLYGKEAPAAEKKEMKGAKVTFSKVVLMGLASGHRQQVRIHVFVSQIGLDC